MAAVSPRGPLSPEGTEAEIRNSAAITAHHTRSSPTPALTLGNLPLLPPNEARGAPNEPCVLSGNTLAAAGVLLLQKQTSISPATLS